jgi:hypothetical protein
LAEEKKGNVFHMRVRNVFPAPDKSSTIYWDQEFIAIGTGKTTLFVQTSERSSHEAGAWP